MPDQTLAVIQAFDNSAKQAEAEASRLDSEARRAEAESHRMEGRAIAFRDAINFLKQNNLSIVAPDEDLTKKDKTPEEILNENPPVPPEGKPAEKPAPEKK